MESVFVVRPPLGVLGYYSIPYAEADALQLAASGVALCPILRGVRCKIMSTIDCG